MRCYPTPPPAVYRVENITMLGALKGEPRKSDNIIYATFPITILYGNQNIHEIVLTEEYIAKLILC